tara:strand:- start:35 stop:259 length:225 start_codon:yes stop_codon:yes gene_type:complete
MRYFKVTSTTKDTPSFVIWLTNDEKTREKAIYHNQTHQEDFDGNLKNWRQYREPNPTRDVEIEISKDEAFLEMI